MKNLTKSLLATLMLMGFSLTVNAGSCGFDGNNKGGLSFSACVKQELINQGRKLVNNSRESKAYYYGFFAKHGIEKGIARMKERTEINIAIGEYSDLELKKVKPALMALEVYIRTLSIEAIKRRVPNYISTSL